MAALARLKVLLLWVGQGAQGRDVVVDAGANQREGDGSVGCARYHRPHVLLRLVAHDEGVQNGRAKR